MSINKGKSQLLFLSNFAFYMLYGVVWYCIIEEGDLMKLYYDKKSKDPTYFIQMGIRNGKKTTTKNVKRIGKHSELLKLTDDPLAYAKLKVAEYNKQMKDSKVDMNITIDFDSKLTPTFNSSSKSTLVNVGYFFLQSIYHDLRISSFFDSIDKGKITYDPDEINRFITFSRILFPRSKYWTVNHIDSFFESPSFEHQHVLRYMDILANNFDDYLTFLYEHASHVISVDTSVCYFDCTNFYSEIECEDDDYTDEVTGEFIKGLRKYGVSKEHRPNPIVQMGLFMDRRGMPISMCINSGSDNEQLCAVPSEKKLIKALKGKSFIYCADAGLGSTNIRKFNDMGGRAFVITQSIKKLSDTLKQAVFNDYDYRLLSDDSRVTIKAMKEFDRQDPSNLSLYEDKAYKVIEVEQLVDLGLSEIKVFKNGSTRKVKSKGTLKQRLIVSFSRKMFEYQRAIRERQIERARNLINTTDPEKIKKGPNDVRRFITKSNKNDDQKDVYIIDEERIKNEEMYDGYYCIATNLCDPAKDVVKIMESRNKIEECFRIMKSYINARPYYHRLSNRIIAHFMICYTALLIYRILEIKLDEYGEHFTTEQILETIKNMKVVNVEDMFYMATYTSSDVCIALNGAFDIGLDKKYYQRKDLNKKIKKIIK